ncbi:hypothetical protein GS938_05570 [Rhodococcus hoagii]|nr:hypothetical protein [Prescottella equi]
MFGNGQDRRHLIRRIQDAQRPRGHRVGVAVVCAVVERLGDPAARIAVGPARLHRRQLQQRVRGIADRLPHRVLGLTETCVLGDRRHRSDRVDRPAQDVRALHDGHQSDAGLSGFADDHALTGIECGPGERGAGGQPTHVAGGR